ncbi:MAG: hypothetical protein M1840_005512 [Geoglossum simile]|nr:MAG: hypothetical protein M1840_005512 [Geoglossum simile]
MKQLVLLSLTFQAMFANGHSWVDSIQKIDSEGQLIGAPGYIRNYTACVANQDVDRRNTYEIEFPSQTFCSPYQKAQFQANGFPRLNASSGSQIVAQYLENGHISAPVVPDSIVGNVYWFGSRGEGIDNTTFGEVQGWKGAPGRGRILNTAQFDDGICGHGDPILPCHSTFQIPFDIVTGGVYRIYWLWDYSGKLGNNTGHIEACSITNIPFKFIYAKPTSSIPLAWISILLLKKELISLFNWNNGIQQAGHTVIVLYSIMSLTYKFLPKLLYIFHQNP